MIIAYLILGAIFLIINGAIYISALWCLWRGIKSFPKKPQCLVWPALLLAVNLYFGLVVRAQNAAEIKALEDGTVYDTRLAPDHIAILDYSSVMSNRCGSICLELLLESKVKNVTIIWDNLRTQDRKKTKSVTYEAIRGDCLNHPSSITSMSNDHAFLGYCIRTVEAVSDPETTFVLDRNLNYFYKSTIKGDSYMYRTGLAIFDGVPPNQKLLAIHTTHPRNEVVKIPVMLRIFNGDGMEGAPQLDGGLSTEITKAPETQPLPTLPYKEERARQKAEALKVAKQKHALIKAALDLEIDGNLDLIGVQKPDIEQAKVLIRKAFQSDDEGHYESAAKFARTYEGFPFLDVMKELAATEKGRPAYLAQSYIDRWIRKTDPQKFKAMQLERKKMREEEKAKRMFENEKRFCELEARRDGRDCSKYQTAPEGE